MLEDRDNKPLTIEALKGYEPEIGRLVWQLEVARERLTSKLVGLDQYALDLQLPDENSIGTLLYHIAYVEMAWLYEEVVQTEVLPPEVAGFFSLEMRTDDGRLTVIAGRTLDEHLHMLARTRHYLLEVFREMDMADFRRLRQMETYSCSPEWVLHHLIQHETEHRGQITAIRTQAEAMQARAASDKPA